MNLVILRDNLARDPEVRRVNTGGKETAVVNFTVATSREYTKSNGEKDKVTSFINCEAWDTGAEMAFVTGEDQYGMLDSIIMFPETWEKYRPHVFDGNVLIFTGKKSKAKDSLIVEKCFVPKS